MRKDWGKRVLALGLTVAMTIGLCACGKDGGGSNNEPASGNSSSLAKEHVYRVQNITLPQMYSDQGGNINIRCTAHRDGKVYMVMQVYDYETYSENDYRVVSMKEDGTDVQVATLEIAGNSGNEDVSESTDEGTTDNDTTDEGNTDNGDDGIALLDTEEGVAAEPGAGDVGEVYPGEESNGYEYSNYNPFVMAADGMIYAMKNRSFEDWSDPENYISEQTYSLCCWNADGSLAWEVEIPGLGNNDDDTWTYVNNMLQGSDGNLYLLITVSSEDNENYKIKINSDGTVGERVKLSEDVAKLINNYDQLVPQDDGLLFVIFRDEEEWTKSYYTTYDIATDTVGEIKDFPSTVSYMYDYNVMMPGKSHDLIYTGNGGIYSWDEGAENGEILVDYINSDLYVESLYGLVELTKDSFLAFYAEDWETGMQAGIFTYVDPADIKDKEVLVMAGRWIDSDVKKRVIAYNRSSQDYRITLKDYSVYNSYDDYQAGLTKLNSDITTGSMPDILISNDLPISNYISKGLIANIDELIKNDEELSKVEFMENAFDAYRVNGKLYYIVPDFEVYSIIAKKAWVGDRETWTMEDMQQALAAMPEGAKAFGGDTTRSQFMYMVMSYCGNQFVDVSTGKCSFNTQDFISMMEFAKTLPSDTDSQDYDSDYWNNYWENYQSQYRQDRTLMMQVNFYQFSQMANSINGYFGEPVSFVGFPTDTGNGSYIMSSTTYVLAAKSKHLDAAWDFMRYYLTDEYQDQVYYFPVQKEKFYEKSKEATERPYWEYTDENGETQREYYDQTIYINGEDIPYGPLSQEQLDEVIQFIESVHNPYYYNEEIMTIINEEIDAFFSGQKTAEAVADTIQRRAQIYVDENQ